MSEMIERITRAFERDQGRLNLKAKPGEIPLSYEAITDEWLSDALCSAHPGAAITGHRLEPADDGNTNRTRIYLDYNAAGRAAGLPPSVFCKASQQLHVRLFLATSGLIVGEDLFYRKFRRLLNMETPECLFAAYDPESFNSIFIFDDLGRQGAIFCTHTFEVTRHRAETQLDLLARLHGRFHGSPELDANGLWTYEAMFDRLDGFLKLEGYSNEGFVAAEAVVPAGLHGRHSEIWRCVLLSNQVQAANTRTMTHNDVHLRNWYLTSDNNMRLADWQCIAAGHWARDVVYTISTSLTPEDRRAWERDLLKFYLDRLHASGGPAVNFAAAWQFYRQHLCSSLIWWTSTLRMATAQPVDATLELIRRMAIAVDDLDALDSFD